jgi:hypothetical protein
VPIIEGITYKDVEAVLSSHLTHVLNEINLKLLEEQLGPKPCWRYANGNAKIPPAVGSIYVVDSNKKFLLASLRTEQDDFPLVVGRWFLGIEAGSKRHQKSELNVYPIS